MTPYARREQNAARYRDLAAAARSSCDRANLEQVRARHAHAAQMWTELADGEELQNQALQTFLGHPKPDTSKGR